MAKISWPYEAVFGVARKILNLSQIFWGCEIKLQMHFRSGYCVHSSSGELRVLERMNRWKSEGIGGAKSEAHRDRIEISGGFSVLAIEATVCGKVRHQIKEVKKSSVKM